MGLADEQLIPSEGIKFGNEGRAGKGRLGKPNSFERSMLGNEKPQILSAEGLSAMPGLSVLSVLSGGAS